MSNVQFQISYIPGIFSDIGTTDDVILNQGFINKIELQPEILKVKTSLEYESVLDDIVTQRLIQSKYIRKFQVQFVGNEKTNLIALQLAQKIIFTDETGKEFEVHNLEITEDRQNNSRPVFYTITFDVKEIKTHVNYLTSDVCKLHNDSGQNVNELDVTITKPSYTQKAELFYNIPTLSYRFMFTVNEITDNIQIGDFLYCHLLKNDPIQLFGKSVECVDKDANFLTFQGELPTSDEGDFYTEVTLDFNPIFYDAKVIERSLNYKIYTLLYEKNNIIAEDGDEIKIQNGLQKVISRNLKNTTVIPFWFDKSNVNELLKFKYLYSINEVNLIDNVSLNLADTKKYYTIETIENIEIEENDSLYNILQVFLTLKYENMEVNTLR